MRYTNGRPGRAPCTTAPLIRGAGPVPNTDLLVREISIRHLIRHRTTDNAVIGAMLDEVTETLIDASGSEARRILVDLPLAGMEMETVLPRRWWQVVQDRIAAFAPAGSGPRAGGIATAAQVPVGDKTDLSLKEGAIPGASQSKAVAGSIPHESAIAGAPQSKTVAGSAGASATRKRWARCTRPSFATPSARARTRALS